MTEVVNTTDRAVWLEQRRHLIGASDIAALAGFNFYKSPADIYVSKVYGVEAVETQYMRAGRLMESVILQMFEEESGLTVTPNAALFTHPTLPFVGATPDGFTSDGGLVEAKSTSKLIDDVSYAHYCQLQWQLGTLGRDHGVIAYLMQGWKFQIYEFAFKPELFESLVGVASEFWNNHVVPQIPPGPVMQGDVAKLIRSHVDGKMIEAGEETRNLLERYRTAKALEHQYRKEVDQYRSQLQEVMWDAEAITIDGNPVVTWKKCKDSDEFDRKRFAAENPELFRQYCQPRPGGRGFVVK